MKTTFSILTFGTLAFFVILSVFQSVNAGEVRESWHNSGGDGGGRNGGGWNGGGCDCGGWNGGGWNGGHNGRDGHHDRRDEGSNFA